MDLVMSPTRDRCFGSTINKLKSPFFHQISPLNNDFNTNLVDYKEALCSGISSPGCSSVSSSSKLPRNQLVVENHDHEPEPLHKRDVSKSSISSPARGMLKCSWNAGLPHYVFSIDESSEVYVASLCKAKSPEDRGLDYLYEFRLEQNDNVSSLAGKMKVNSSIKLDSSNSETMETEFVLFGSNEEPSHMFRKNKGLSKKVTEVFKTRRSSMLRSLSKFGGLDYLREISSIDTCEVLCTNVVDTLPNFELVAIVVRDDNICHDDKIGGWGLKFLKKVGTNRHNVSLVASPVDREYNLGDNSGSSTKIDVIVPAGFHGRPQTSNGGPSSLVERWKSNGICDCGGWDIGCPLKVLKTDMQRDCKSLDLCIKGTEEGAPPQMKLMNIGDDDDSYSVHFQSSLSSLQCFSIAVAIIHSRTPNLRPRVYRA